MNTTVVTRAPADQRVRSQSERALRVAAATLRQATSEEVRATRVVCNVAPSDRRMFEALVSDIAAELRVDAEVRHRPGTASVRFARWAR